MKSLFSILFLAIVLASCGGEGGDTEDNYDESYSLEISPDFEEKFKGFTATKAGAIYDDRRNQLQIYFINYDNPEYMFGYCCDQPKGDKDLAISFTIPLNDKKDNIKDPSEGSCSYANKETHWGINMVGRSMETKIDKLDGKVAEGSFTYKEDEGDQFIKASFKLKLIKPE